MPLSSRTRGASLDPVVAARSHGVVLVSQRGCVSSPLFVLIESAVALNFDVTCIEESSDALRNRTFDGFAVRLLARILGLRSDSQDRYRSLASHLAAGAIAIQRARDDRGDAQLPRKHQRLARYRTALDDRSSGVSLDGSQLESSAGESSRAERYVEGGSWRPRNFQAHQLRRQMRLQSLPCAAMSRTGLP